MTDTKILLTGANGFLGRNMLDLLAAQDQYLVVATTRSNQPCLASRYRSIEFTQLDVSEEDDTDRIMSDYRPTHVINCAAYGVHPQDRNPERAVAVNSLGAVNLLRQAIANGASRFIQIGTCSEYGPVDEPLLETTPLFPRGVYASTKAAATLMMHQLAQNTETQLLVARLFGIWGPHEPPHRLLPTLIAQSADGKRIALSAGQQVRDFSYAPEVARILYEMCWIELEQSPLTVNVGSGQPMTVQSFARRAAEVIGCGELMDFGAIKMRSDEVNSMIANVEKLKGLGLPVPEPASATLFRAFLTSRNNGD